VTSLPQPRTTPPLSHSPPLPSSRSATTLLFDMSFCCYCIRPDVTEGASGRRLRRPPRCLLTVLTTRIRHSKPRVREEYMASFMHIFSTNKVPQLCCEFHRKVHIWGEIGINVPHEQGTAEPPGPAGLKGSAGPAGAADHAPWLVPGPEHLLSLEQHLDEHDSLKNFGLIQRLRLGSMSPLVRWLNRHNRHSKVIICILERRLCITRHGRGPIALRGPDGPIDPRAGRNRPKEPTYNHLRSSDQGHPRQEVVDHRAGRTS
jgi:hypothetical protein